MSIKNIKIFLLIFFLLGCSGSLFCQWTLATNTSFATSFASVNGLLFSGKQGVSVSTDNGISWTWAGNGLPAFNTINTLYSKGSDLYVGISSNGVYKSTNNGTFWSQVTNGLGSFRSVNFLAGDSNNIYAGTTDGLYRSTDNAQSWTNWGLDGLNVTSLLVKNSYIFACIILDGVRVSSNSGSSWSNGSTGLTGFVTINCLESKGSSVFCATSNGGVFKTTNNGVSWVSSSTGVPTNNHTIYSLKTVGNTLLFASTYGVYSTTNNGANWVAFNDGIPAGTQVNNNDLFVYNNFCFVGANNGIYKRPVTQISEVRVISSEIRSFELKQNYPNPFNPSTVIRYSISASTYVSLNVYDITGKFISNLTDERLNAGTYEVNFKNNGLASGIYYYTLRTDEQVITKQMVVAK
ncbi:hypothetical protein BH10BAC5_BH10BAC5_23000 [soil metagenome]